jgi:DNA-binding CsgD family transcriptional regulator
VFGPSTSVFIALAVLVPLYAVVSFLLVLKYRTAARPLSLALCLVFFAVPLFSLGAACFLKASTYGLYLGLYISGDLARLTGVPFTAYFVIRKKPSQTTVIGFFLFALLFLGSVVPEQVQRDPLIALVRTLLRYGLFWGCCLVAVVNLRRIGDRYDRVVVFTYSLLSFFTIPFVVIGMIARLRDPVALADQFFTNSPGGFAAYVGFCNLHLLFALIMLFKRKTGDVDLPGFAGTYSLSGREKEIAELMLAGRSNPEIGEKLFISAHTVRNHTHRIFKKCRVKTRYELIALLRSHSFPRSIDQGPAKRAYRKRDSRV